MSTLRILCASVVLLGSLAATASAADRGASISQATLASMGLGNAQPMSDSQGMAVRGMGSIAIVWGTGYGVIVRPHLAAGVGLGSGLSIGGSIAFAK